MVNYLEKGYSTRSHFCVSEPNLRDALLRDIKGNAKDNKLMYISNDDKQNNPFYRLKLMVKKFGHY